MQTSAPPTSACASSRYCSATNPALKIRQDIRRQWLRLPRRFVEQHRYRLRRSHACALGEHHLIEGDGSPAELHDAKSHFDRAGPAQFGAEMQDRKSTRLNSSHGYISYAVFCLKKKK